MNAFDLVRTHCQKWWLVFAVHKNLVELVVYKVSKESAPEVG